MSDDAGVGSDAGGGVTPLGDGVWQLDLGFGGRPGVIAAYVVAGDGEVALIETGPASTLPALLAGLAGVGFAPDDLTAVLVTHIHLDHAGAAGRLLRRAPRATVHVHPVGAPHLADPTKLVASATRIYGDRMDELWGEIAPVPAQRIMPLEDGVPRAIAGRVLTPLFTPGHASHHVAFWDAAASTAFTGDVGGVRLAGSGYVCPPTPPPDLDFAAWEGSIRRLEALDARRLCATHFGAFADAAAHLGQLRENLARFRDLAAVTLAAGPGAGGDQAALTARITAAMAEALAADDPAGADPAAQAERLATLEAATPSYMAAMGLGRWWAKRGAAERGSG